MRTYRSTRKSGFTLVEILIVVIILGILAAIVIPQFTNASQDARKSSLTSQLQTIRSQLELYKLQHRDSYPTDDGTTGGVWDWTLMTTKTDDTGAAGGLLGPYLQAPPANPINDSTVADNTKLVATATDPTAGSDVTGGPAGWVFVTSTGKIFATTKSGSKIYDESSPNATTNDE